MSNTTATKPSAAATFNADRETALTHAMDIAVILEEFFEGERIDWGHAGTMAAVKVQLSEIVDTLLNAEQVGR